MCLYVPFWSEGGSEHHVDAVLWNNLRAKIKTIGHSVSGCLFIRRVHLKENVIKKICNRVLRPD